MSTPVIQTSFTTGEVAPSIFGHVDLARYHNGASTMRNFYVGYRGGAYSRAGTPFVGFSKQTGRSYPPRLVPFQFKIDQGLALEFGHLYMRVILNGSFVTESATLITNITQASPAVLTTSAVGAVSATANTGAVSAPYAPGDTVTLAGGVSTRPAILTVSSTKLLSIVGSTVGHGYVPADTVTLAGGTQTIAPIVTVVTTGVSSATVNAAGTGGTNGTQVVTGTTGTGTFFQANVAIAGGAITAVNSIALAGSYTVNPTSLAAEPVTGAGLVGATLTIKMGVVTANVTTNGLLTANPAGNIFTQTSTSGSGAGEVFIFGILGPVSLTVSDAGVYATFPSNPVAQASSSGAGLGATFNVTTGTVAAFNTGDWVFLSNISGMTQLNGVTVVVTQLTPSTYSLADVYGNPINTTTGNAYAGGGNVQRIFTLPTIYSEQDLPWLKWTQSADTMTICCVNQQSLVEYQPQDLRRGSTNTSWTFSPVVPTNTILPPTGLTAVATATGNVNYSYVVTAVDANGAESVASAAVAMSNAVDIANTAGSIIISYQASVGAVQYNVYKATPAHGTPIASGATYGFAGTAYGTRFVDNDIVSDFTQTPPLHRNPFARGKIISAQMVSGGTNFTTATATPNTVTGSGASLTAVVNTGLSGGGGGTSVSPGPVSAIIVNDGGQNFAATDSVTISGNGSGANANLTIGPQTGTYPSVPAYFQQRRVFAGTLNNPDTYFMSKPGAFTNFDVRLPTISSDAISGSPWAVQVNGIQFMVPMPGGLVILTGLSAWQLTGTGGSSLNPQPITPSSQQAQPQAYNGCAATIPPVKIDYDVIYVQAKGSIYRDLAYNFFTNIYTGSDLTQNSSHLFTGFSIREHAWAEEPYKILWSIRDDGVLLSLTFNKPQEVAGWARHDTQGFYETVCSVTEPPVDALYLGTQRMIGVNTAYMIERMDDRLWNDVEGSCCVDCGASLAQPAPVATLTVSSAAGAGAVTGATNLVGGAGYSAGTSAAVVDDNGLGNGSGAVPVLTIVGGVITAVTFPLGSQGTSYAFPNLVFTDPANTGHGASATLVLDNSATFTASASVFAPGNVGSVIRTGGGKAVVTAYVDGQHVTANILSPIVDLIPNSSTPRPQTSGNWTMTAPVTKISGLNHLIGATVTGLADGNVIPPTLVAGDGSITLAAPASSVTVGLGYQCQLQSIYLDVGTPTIQGQRKKVSAVTARLEQTRGLKIGSNQPDGSVQSPPQLAPQWFQLADVEDKAVMPYNSTTEPLWTGDTRIPVSGGFQTPGQVAVQQDNPLPATVLAFIPEVWPGDMPEMQAAKKQGRQQQAQGR